MDEAIDKQRFLNSFLDQLADEARDDDAQLAVAITRHAGQLAAQMLHDGLTTEYKTSISDVVTAADRAAEEFVVTALAQLRPADGILGEEGSAKESQSGKVWVIDPIDGTYNFTSGSDYWCSALALITGAPENPDSVILGAIYRPATKQSWVGGPKLPTVRIDQSTTPLAIHDLPLAQTCAGTYLHSSIFSSGNAEDKAAVFNWSAAISQAATWRGLGSASVDMAGVTEGRLGVWFQRDVAAWDWLPGKAVIEGAGGVCTSAGRWKVAGAVQAVAEVVAKLG